MSYLIQSMLASDMGIRDRITACAATEGIADPFVWTVDRMWQFSAQPGWSSAYASARLSHLNNPSSVVEPGVNEAAITDGMILSAVQAVRALD